MRALRIGLIIPEDTPPTGGNRISAGRVEEALKQRGIEAETLPYRKNLPEFDVYHAWNTVTVGMRLVKDGISPDQMIATWTGTDLWNAWVKDFRPIADQLNHIRHQVVFTADARQRILEDVPTWRDKITVIPPSVNVDLFHPEGARQEVAHPFILVAGGVRPVKRSSWSIELTEKLRRMTGRDIQLGIAGPVREEHEWQRVQQLALGRSWVHLLGEVPKEEMPTWYRTADFVLNTSEVEGLSNALMEAMSSGSLVIASDIRGNRGLILDGQTGLLFEDAETFLDLAADVLARREFYHGMRQMARQHILSRHAVDIEIDHYLRLYDDCLTIRGCCR